MNREQLIQNTNAELNAIFNDKSLKPQERGELGERIVTRLVRFWSEGFPSAFVEESFIFPQGPVMPTTNAVEENPVTEIDCLLVTPYKIFVIEIKTVYGDLVINDDFTMDLYRGGTKDPNFTHNYLRQNEMHARHLYYQLHQVLPKGQPKYIEQVIVLTGNMSVEDNRKLQDSRAHVTITNNLLTLIEELNQPNEFLISAKAVRKTLNKIRVLDRQRLLDSQNFKG